MSLAFLFRAIFKRASLTFIILFGYGQSHYAMDTPPEQVIGKPSNTNKDDRSPEIARIVEFWGQEGDFWELKARQEIGQYIARNQPGNLEKLLGDLKEKGADLPNFLSKFSKSTQPFLLKALTKENPSFEVIEILLKYDADPNFKGGEKYQFNAAHMAAQHQNSLDILRLLVDYKVNFKLRNCEGRTALDLIKDISVKKNIDSYIRDKNSRCS